jgi:ADP-ribosylglycohydrolase
MTSARDRFIGSLVGCAIGDALGAPFEGALPSSIPLDIGAEIDFRKMAGYPLGQYTDDTQMTLATVRAICRAKKVDGAEIASEFVKLWESDEIVGAGASCSEGVYNIIRHGMRWEEAGAPEGRAGNGTAMRAAPIGLWNFRHPERIQEDARISSIITHQDPRSIAGAAAVAKAVQLCFDPEEIHPGEFLALVGASVRNKSALFSKCLAELAPWVDLESADALPHIYASGEPDVGPREPNRITGYVIPTVLCSFYFFLRTPNDFLATVAGAIKAGGDTDTSGAIAGAIGGARNGIQAIPARLLRNLKDSKEIVALAEELYELAAER